MSKSPKKIKRIYESHRLFINELCKTHLYDHADAITKWAPEYIRRCIERDGEWTSAHTFSFIRELYNTITASWYEDVVDIMPPAAQE